MRVGCASGQQHVPLDLNQKSAFRFEPKVWNIQVLNTPEGKGKVLVVASHEAFPSSCRWCGNTSIVLGGLCINAFFLHPSSIYLLAQQVFYVRCDGLSRDAAVSVAAARNTASASA